MFLLGLWPSCAYQGCPWPALLQFRNRKDGREIMVNLCPWHWDYIGPAVQEMEALRLEQELEEAKALELNEDPKDGQEE